jgi:hypothetical protein
VIAITGPGRSGTSFLADLYRNLGFDPGGGWDRKINAGREHPDVVKINEELYKELDIPLGPPVSNLGAQRWDRVPELAETYGDRLREVAGRLDVAKDPRFSWTLRVWLEAQAPIQHVVLTFRRTYDVQASARRAGMGVRADAPTERLNQARSVLLYRMGSAITACADYPVGWSLLFFPDYLSEPEDLYEQLEFPKPVDKQKFLKVFKKTADPKRVHFGQE